MRLPVDVHKLFVFMSTPLTEPHTFELAFPEYKDDQADEPISTIANFLPQGKMGELLIPLVQSSK